jgi:hypothetical protein
MKTIFNRIARGEGGAILTTVAVSALVAFAWPVVAMT